MEKLEAEQVAQRLETFPEWSLNGDKLQRTFSFDDYAGAIAFVNRVFILAEEHGHYPDIMIRYSRVAKVTLTLTTHEAEGLTGRDFNFARSTDELFQVV